MKHESETNWRKYKPRPITAAQTRALQIAYKRLVTADDPRADIGLHRTGDERADRLRWAWHKLGREILSFEDLTLSDAQYLLDYCNGKPTKLDIAINEQFLRLNVRDQAAYFDAMCQANARSKNIWHFHGRTIHQLSRYDKWQLLTMLKTRYPKQEPRTQGSGMAVAQ